MAEYKYWKWTKPIKSTKSSRLKPIKEKNLATSTEKKAPETHSELSTIHTEPSDKRSICNERISSRYMVIQTQVNPFLKDSDYISDIKVQDTLLRPRDSNVSEKHHKYIK